MRFRIGTNRKLSDVGTPSRISNKYKGHATSRGTVISHEHKRSSKYTGHKRSMQSKGSSTNGHTVFSTQSR